MALGLGLGLSKRKAAGGGATSPYLDGVLDSVVFELDATVSDSYSGSGETWVNLISSPADGSAQTDNDFYLGGAATTDGNEPTFDTDKFTVDGADFFSIVERDPANIAPSLLNITNTTSSQFYFFTVLHIGATLDNNDYFFGSGTSNAGNTLLSIGTQSNGDLRIIVVNDTDAGIVHVAAAAALSINTTYIIGVSVDLTSSTNNVRAWVNSTTSSLSSLASSANTEATQGGAMLMARTGGTVSSSTQNMPSGDWMRWAAFGNEFIDDTQAASIIDHIETRHGVDYTP